MLKKYILFYIKNQIIFIKMVEFENISYGFTDSIIYLKQRPFSFIVIDYYKKKGFILKNQFNNIEVIKFILKPYYLLFGAIIGKILSLNIKTNISGEHFIINIALAIAGAMASGLTLTEAAQGVTRIKSVAKNMEILIGNNKEIFSHKHKIYF